MQVRDLGLGVKEITPRRFGDTRGYFAETFHRERYVRAGIEVDWVQDNQSYSADRHVLRGLHLQVAPFQQSKLIRVLKGSIYDVAVDVRPSSPSFSKYVASILSADSFNQLYIPAGFAHGFLTLEPGVEVFYKASGPYEPSCERAIAWNDTDLAIDWPIPPGERPVISEKDAAAMSLAAFVAIGEI